jgi:hypothetical protein
MGTSRLIALMVGAAIVASACGSTPATPVPTSAPSVAAGPVITPNPQLHDPASLGAILGALQAAGLTMTPNAADAGSGGMVERLHLTYDGWPLTLTEYTSARTLGSESGFNSKVRPSLGDPPFALAGLNILVEFGANIHEGSPAVPDPQFGAAFEKIVLALNPLIGPLRQESSSPVALPTPVPSPTASPAPLPSGPGASPKATPKPKVTPKPKKTTKP